MNLPQNSLIVLEFVVKLINYSLIYYKTHELSSFTGVLLELLQFYMSTGYLGGMFLS